jgi:CheY-like chemotaxis protein
MKQKIVLYIEDNYHNRRIVRKILQSRGYTLVEAEDGLSGLAMVHELKPPLVLLDIGLPGIDGLEVLARVNLSKPIQVQELINKVADHYPSS